MYKFFRLFLFSWYLFFSLETHAQQEVKILHDLNRLLVNIVMDDLFTPPIASRIYVYPNIAFYECIRYKDKNYSSLAGKLNGLKKLPAPGAKNDPFISACIAYSYVAQGLVGSEYKIENWRSAFVDSISKTGNKESIELSMAFGKKMADSINAWIRKDNYLETRALARHVISNKEGGWIPTPTEYAPGMEPHWNKIRPLTLTSSTMFSPAKKLVYSPSMESEFYQNVKEVYDISMSNDTVKRLMAHYWDDNPNVSVQQGHLTYFIHKISPGGHWIMIAGQGCERLNTPLVKTSYVYTSVAVAIFDAFIATWDEKYRTDLIRPVTVINEHINEKWKPYLDTPPFPEFTSGHAVISNSAASTLTTLLGEDIDFTDKTEVPFGLEPRSFESFNKAAYEASWSRVYGGIHYPETARVSIEVGQRIGKYVVTKLK